MDVNSEGDSDYLKFTRLMFKVTDVLQKQKSANQFDMWASGSTPTHVTHTVGRNKDISPERLQFIFS